MSDPALTITCPVCDAPNATRSVFCAECGTALHPDAEHAAPTRANTTIPDSQSTAVIPSGQTWTDPPDASRPREAPTFTSVEPVIALPTEDRLSSNGTPIEFHASRRGFWLGLIAVVLMLIILGMWIWGGLLDAGTRRSVEDLFR